MSAVIEPRVEYDVHSIRKDFPILTRLARGKHLV